MVTPRPLLDDASSGMTRVRQALTVETAPSPILEMPAEQLDALCHLICEEKLLDTYQPNFVALEGREVIAASPKRKYVLASVAAHKKRHDMPGSNGVQIVPLRTRGTLRYWRSIQALLNE